MPAGMLIGMPSGMLCSNGIVVACHRYATSMPMACQEHALPHGMHATVFLVHIWHFFAAGR